MVKEILAFIAIVQNPKIGFNEITGKLLHHLVDLIGGPDKLGDEENETACSIRKSMEFLGKKGAKAFMSQDQAELLLSLIPKSKLPTAEPSAAEAARRREAEKALDKAAAEKSAPAGGSVGSV
jgi:hypothetical protein